MVEQGRFAPTEEGTPQGGVISPMLLNIALHGMEEAAGVRYLASRPYGGRDQGGSRYWCDTPTTSSSCVTPGTRPSRSSAGWVSGWPHEALRSTRTRRISSTLDQGFDFLGFNVRRYDGKLLIKPSQAAVKRIRQRLAAEVRSLRGANADSGDPQAQPDHPGLGRLLPERGLQRGVLRARQLPVGTLYRWALRAHLNKPRHWVSHRYFGMFNPSRTGPVGLR